MLDIILLILFLAVLVLGWIALYDSTRFVVVRYTITQNKVKGGYRAVVLADLHNKQFGKGNELLLKAIEEQKPNAVWVAGDILTAHPGKSMEPAIALVTELAKKYPVYYGNGNHEHRLKLYPEVYGEMAEEYAQSLEQVGVRPLVNEHVVLEAFNLAIYGLEIDREYYKRFTLPEMEEGYLQRILGKPEEKRFNVLLAHNPDYFPEYVKWGVDLVLSGHVHGGMIRIPGWKGVVSPSVRLFPRYDGGRFTKGKSTMILSRGLGMHTIPIRLFNPGELVVVELEYDADRKADNSCSVSSD